MSESTSGRMVTRPSPLILFASVLLILLSSCSCEPDPAAGRAEKSSLPPKAPLAPVPVPERKADHVSDVNNETLSSQGSDTGYGAPSNEYNQQPQQQQDYQPPPPPPPPAQAYGPQVHVTEQDYSRPADQQQSAYDQPQQQQQYDQQSQGYGVKGQSSRPQAAYSSQQPQQAYPASQQSQGYNQPAAPAPQSYPAATQAQQSYAPPSYSSQENSYNSQPPSYGSGNSAYQAPGSYNSNPASQSYGTPLESSYESPSDYANDADDEIPYDNNDPGYGTSAPDQQQLSPVNNNNNYQSSPAGQSSGKGQGYQVAAPLAPAAPAYPPPQPQQQYRPPQQQQPYPPSSYQQQNQAYENGASQEPSAPSKGGYAAAAPSGNAYSSPADSGSSHPSGGSDSRGGPTQQSQSYPETSYSYGQQQQQQQGSNYNMPLNYGGFRPIQLVAPPAGSSSYKGNPSKPLVVAIIQKPAASVGQHQNSYSSPQGDHYNAQLQAYPSHENNQYQSQQIPANSYSGPPLPLNSYASPSANSHSSYQSPGQGSYPPSSPPANSHAPQSHANPPYPSSSGPNAQYPAPGQPQNYQPEVQQQYASPGPVRGYEYATEQESSDDEYQSGHPAEYSSPGYNPSAPGYPEYPKAPAAQPYPNAGFALDYSEGKPYGGRWLQKPYGKKFVKPKNPYAGNAGALDVTLPLKYGPPPPPEEPKSPPPSYLAPYASVPQVSVYPEEMSAYPFGAPLHSAPLSATLPSKTYRNPSLTQSFGSYGVQNHNLRIPSASSYGTFTSDDSDLYASQLAAAASAVLPSKRKKQKSPVVDAASELAAGLPDEETSYKLIPSASKLIPNIVKSPFKKIMKAFSKNKLLAWKRKSSKEAKSVTSD